MERPGYLAACSKTWFPEGCVCETVIRNSLRSPCIVQRLGFSNAWDFQAFPSCCLAKIETAEKTRLKAGCEIAGSSLGAAR